MSNDTLPGDAGVPQNTGPIRPNGQHGFLLVPWASGMDRGSGYDSVARTVLSSPALEGKPLADHPVRGTMGQYVQKKVLQIETIEKMREVLQLGSELDVGYDAFSANSVGKFLKETRVDSYNLYFLVICYVQNTEVSVDEFELDPRWQALDDAEFRSGFGDYFVSGWVSGGYLIGLAEIRATPKQALTKVKAEAGGRYSDGMFSAKTKFASAWESWASRSDLESRLEVIYAGMDGTTFRTVAHPARPPGEPRRDEPAPVRHDAVDDRASRDLRAALDRPLAERELLRVDDEDNEDAEDDGDSDNEYLSEEEAQAFLEAERMLPKRQAAPPLLPDRAGPAPRPAPPPQPPHREFEHLTPGLQAVDPVDYRKVEMTMQGLLDAADALPGQARTYGVPLYAILESYAPKYRPVGESGVSRLEYDGKRDCLNRTYLKARLIYNSVSYALEHGSQSRCPMTSSGAPRPVCRP